MGGEDSGLPKKYEELVLAYKQGKGIRRIVREFGISINEVYYDLGQANVELRRRNMGRSSNVTSLRMMRGTKTRITTIPRSILRELDLDPSKSWEVEWRLEDAKEGILKAIIREKANDKW